MKKRLLVGFACPDDQSREKCFKIAERFLDKLGYCVFRHDALYPLRFAQKQLYWSLGLSHCGEPLEPVRFHTDNQFMDFMLEIFEQDLGPALKNKVEIASLLNEEYRVAVITTDPRSKIYNTMKKLGYFFVRVERPERDSREKFPDAEIAEDCLIGWRDFRKAPKHSVEEALLKIIKRKSRG